MSDRYLGMQVFKGLHLCAAWQANHKTDVRVQQMSVVFHQDRTQGKGT